MNKLTFRIVCSVLVVVAAMILVLSLHGRHRPPADDGTYPLIPRTDSSTVAR